MRDYPSRLYEKAGIMRIHVLLGLGVCLSCLGSVVWFHGSTLERRAHAAGRAAPTPPPLTACEDRDGDGYGRGCGLGPDCNDDDAAIHPGQPEVCNFRDDDCNALVDDSPLCRTPTLSQGTVPVAAGEFIMGSAPGTGAADEYPRHRVWVSGFSLDTFEVTNRRYRACVAAGKCVRPRLVSSHLRNDYFENDAFADYPVIFVDHAQAKAYCEFAGGRLPTESEWEKAARGKSPSIAEFPWGDREPDCSLANMGGKHSCVDDTDRVGRRDAGKSAVGAFDMAGNVWEWVADWYDATYYAKSPPRDPLGPGAGNLHVIRGGCWQSGASSLRVSCRKATLASTFAYNIGVRCAYGKGS